MYEHPYSTAVLSGDRFKAIRKGYQNPSLIRPASVRFARSKRDEEKNDEEKNKAQSLSSDSVL